MSDITLTGMLADARAVFIPDPEALIKELGEMASPIGVVDAIALVKQHTVVINDSRLIPLQTLMDAKFPDELVNHASDELRRSVGLAVLQKVATLTLSKEGEWPE